jgi:hypothetical protein
LIRLYTFRDDLVLDPFMGSGSALVAAARLGRRYVGYDLDPTYVAVARRRVEDALAPQLAHSTPRRRKRISPPAQPLDEPPEEDFHSRATREGKASQKLAEEVLVDAGFVIQERNHRIPKTGVTVNFVAEDANGKTWLFDVSGAFTSHRGGLLRTDTVWKCLGRAHAIRGRLPREMPVVFLTTHLPRRPSEGDTALRAAGPDAFFDAIEMLSDEGRSRLEQYSHGGCSTEPLLGFWTASDLARVSP